MPHVTGARKAWQRWQMVAAFPQSVSCTDRAQRPVSPCPLLGREQPQARRHSSLALRHAERHPCGATPATGSLPACPTARSVGVPCRPTACPYLPAPHRRSQGSRPVCPPAGPPPEPAPSTAARRPRPRLRRGAATDRAPASRAGPPWAANPCARQAQATHARRRVPAPATSRGPPRPGAASDSHPDHANRRPRPPTLHPTTPIRTRQRACKLEGAQVVLSRRPAHAQVAVGVFRACALQRKTVS